METKDINKKNLEIATKAITDFGIAANGLINALMEVVKNRGGEIKINRYMQLFPNDECMTKKIFIKDGFLCVEHVGVFGNSVVSDIMQFEYEYLTLCRLLTYAASA